MFPGMYKVRRKGEDRQGSVEEPTSNSGGNGGGGGGGGGVGKPEWQNETWRRNSNRWPPSADSPPVGSGPQHHPLSQSASSGGMPYCPPPIPAPPSEPQDDLNKGCSGSPIPRRLNQRSRSDSPAMHPRGSTPNRGSTPRRQRPEESSVLRVPEGGRGQRSRSSSPYEVWGTPEEQWDPDSGIKNNPPSPASASPSLQRRRGPVSDSNSDVFQCDNSQATDAEEVSPSTNGPQEVPEMLLPSENCQIVVDNSEQVSRVNDSNGNVLDNSTTNHISSEICNGSQIETSEPTHRHTPQRDESNDRAPATERCKRESSNEFETPTEISNRNSNEQEGSKPIELHLHISGTTNQNEVNGFDSSSLNEENDGEDEQTNGSPEVANEWKHLLGDALSGSIDDGDDDFSFETGKNAFYQEELPPELFKGSAVSYMPSSKEEFLKNQQDEDEKYIMNALNEEREELLKSSDDEQENEVIQEDVPSRDNNTCDTNHLNVSDNEAEERAWSPGAPVFRQDVEEHRLNKKNDEEEEEEQEEQEAESEEASDASSESEEDDEETPWWERRRPVKMQCDSPVAWWEQDYEEDGVEYQPAVVPTAPPMPGVVPPPPPPFGASKVNPGATMPKIRKEQIDSIRKAVRTRPDWHTLMKDLEGGVKLRKVQDRNDRSQPILPGSRGKNGKFVYDSEKPTVVNELLHEIQRGVKLRHAKTNDRSRPDFSRLGLKRFRRQLTVEEKKNVKPEDPEALPSSSDDEEDIDCMRDDLTSTKTQLADEIKKTKKVGREKKVMQIDIEALQSEIKKLKRQLKEAGVVDKPLLNGEAGIMPKLEKSMSKLRMSERDELDFGELDNIEGEIKELNGQIDVQRKRAEGSENKVIELEQKLILSDSSGDEWEGRAIFFEKKYKALQRDQNIELPDISMASVQTDPVEFASPVCESHPNPIDGFGSSARKSGSRKSFASQFNRMESFQEEMDGDSSSSSEEESEEEEEEEEMEDQEEDGEEGEEEDEDEEMSEEKMAKLAEKEAKRVSRDSELWNNKLEHAVAREINVKTERNNIRERIRKFYRDMYNERVEFLKAKSELDELVNGLKDPNDEEEPECEDDDEEEEEESPGHEEPGWWFDKPDLKPRKLKKKKKKLNADGEVMEEEEEEEEDLEDLTQLEEPCWSDTENEESDQDDENDSAQVKLNFLQSRTKKHEDKMATIKKDNYLLKTEADRCKEQYGQERLRRRRLDEELNMLVSDMQ